MCDQSYHENHVNIKRKKLLDVIFLDVKINFIREKSFWISYLKYLQ